MALQLPLPKDLSKDFRKLLAFGTGIGIEIGADALEVLAARVRPSKVDVLGRLVIPHYAERPAAEWGAEYARFLKSLGMQHISATVLLPRREVIVRQVAMPGVAAKDVEGAIRFQIDTMHPYGEEDVVWGYSRVAYGSRLVGGHPRPPAGSSAAPPSTVTACSSRRRGSRPPASRSRRPRCTPLSV